MIKDNFLKVFKRGLNFSKSFLLKHKSIASSAGKCFKRYKFNFCALVLMFIFATVFLANGIVFTDEEIAVYVDDVKLIFSDQNPINVDNRILVPLRAIFDALGADIEWDAENREVNAYRTGISVKFKIDDNKIIKNGQEISIDVPARIIGDRTMVPVRAVSEAFGAGVGWDDKKYSVIIMSDGSEVNSAPGKNANSKVMESTEISDEFRLNSLTKTEGPVYLFDDKFAMELINIDKNAAREYATIVNGIASCFAGVNVYDIVAPTASEFYAPSEYYTNETYGISRIYDNLSSNVTPVNVVRPLMTHANEKLYFSTDHHWTQRGAFYAYSAFSEAAGFKKLEITDFPKDDFENYAGSFARVTNGTEVGDILKANPDYFERFLPTVDVHTSIYTDQKLEVLASEPDMIDCSVNGYETFLEGDYSITKLETNVKNGRRLVVIKDSYGNPFSTWAVNHYQEIYAVDYRCFNGYAGNEHEFSLYNFYNQIGGFDDLIILSYPVSVTADDLRLALKNIL